MANIRSQIKRNRQNLKQWQRNLAVRSRYKTFIRRFETAVEGGDRAVAEEALRAVQRELDKAAAKGVIHRNKAANKKSQLARQLERL